MSFIKSLPVFSLLLALSFTSTEAARFSITNRCSYSVGVASNKASGRQLNPSQTWSLFLPSGTASGRIWAQTNSQPTLAEFTLNGWNNLDFYDISVIDGFNVPMEFSPTSNGCRSLRCDYNRCPDAYLYPTDDTKTHSCPTGTNYRVVFCP